jgi:ectoine hydroxylase-related dioxygenase (phytanoyl-CoA dioxygenase family)
MNNSISLLFKNTLLPHLQSKSNKTQKHKINKLKDVLEPRLPIEFINKQQYTNKDNELENNGYKIIRNVFKNKSEGLKKIAQMADTYNLNIHEFVDKDPIFEKYINNILTDEGFINEYYKVFREPFLWQKATIHRKYYEPHNLNLFDKTSLTTEHMDITETPNSKLTITAYIALTNQTIDDSRLKLYPKSHHCNPRIPTHNFDYMSSLNYDMEIIGDINSIIRKYPCMICIRECLYHLLVLNLKEFDILKSTFILMLYNPSIFDIDPITINLNQGDVLFFLSDVLHGSTQHLNKDKSRVSLAIRGGEPYYEHSSLISKCVSDDFYTTNNYLIKNNFLFSGTKDMICKIPYKSRFLDIIYEIE